MRDAEERILGVLKHKSDVGVFLKHKSDVEQLRIYLKCRRVSGRSNAHSWETRAEVN